MWTKLASLSAPFEKLFYRNTSFILTKYQTFGPRFWAAVIDGFVLAPISLLDDYLKELLLVNSGILIIWTIIAMSAYQIYSVLMHGKYGQTIGKKVMQVKIVNFPNETSISYRTAFIRDLPYAILVTIDILVAIVLILSPTLKDNSMLTLITDLLGYAGLVWFLVEIVTMLFNQQNRAVHDIIAKTVVIKI